MSEFDTFAKARDDVERIRAILMNTHPVRPEDIVEHKRQTENNEKLADLLRRMGELFYTKNEQADPLDE